MIGGGCDGSGGGTGGVLGGGSAVDPGLASHQPSEHCLPGQNERPAGAEPLCPRGLRRTE